MRLGMAYQFDVLGEPKGQPRVKASRIGGFVRVYTPGGADAFKAAIKAAAVEVGLLNKRLEGPIRIKLIFRMPRPKNHFRSGKFSKELKPNAPYWHTTKPDADNITKAVMDALNDIGVWVDDSQVCSVQAEKVYVEGMAAPSSTVTIEAIL